MKIPSLLALVASAAILTSCSGPGGPATRAGHAVDTAVYHVGSGISHAGRAIENAATGN